jgi:hypothetical protein
MPCITRIAEKQKIETALAEIRRSLVSDVIDLQPLETPRESISGADLKSQSLVSCFNHAPVGIGAAYTTITFCP